MPRQADFANTSWFTNRIIVLSVFVQLLMLVLVGRLWYIQIASGQQFAKQAKENRLRLIPLKAPRGLIFDREKKLVVNNRPVYTVSIIPQGVSEIDRVTAELSRLLAIPQKEILAKIAKQQKRSFQPVKLSHDVGMKIISILAERKRDFPGVIIESEHQRSYIYKELAAHLLGYVGEISEQLLDTPKYQSFYPGDLIGQLGIEKTLDSRLQGVSGGKQVEVDAFGQELRTIFTKKPRPGHNLTLTIDLALQKAATAALSGRIGVVVALNPNNGEILALVSNPAFDPNLFAGRISAPDWQKLNNNPWRPLVNRVISNHYPPGSTFKPITAIAALTERTIGYRELISCPGYYRLGKMVFKCWKEGGHGSIDVTEALIHSCNVFFSKAGYRTGIEQLSRYASLFRLGTKTNVALTNEVDGLIPTPQWKKQTFNLPWYPGDTVQFSFGQGEVLVTPLQLLNVYAALANGGTFYQPQVVKEIRSVDGQLVHKYTPQPLAKIEFNPAALKTVRLSLWKVVNRFGTGSKAYIKGMDICGKTGTAQVADVPYDEKKKELVLFKLRPHSWFVSFAPYKFPRIALLVMVEHGGEGSKNAVPIAKKVYEEFFKNYPPDTAMIDKYRVPYMKTWFAPPQPKAVTPLAASSPTQLIVSPEKQKESKPIKKPEKETGHGDVRSTSD